MREGAFNADHIQAELGEVLIGRHPGRRTQGELTLFKSLGISVEDVAAAAYVARKARDAGVGKTVAM
jgi:ornithine cyclodeaminase